MSLRRSSRHTKPIVETLVIKTEETTQPMPIVKAEETTQPLPIVKAEETTQPMPIVKTEETTQPIPIVKKENKKKRETAITTVKRPNANKKLKKESDPSESLLQPPPKTWETVYDILEKYRQVHKAAVDTMGCERLADRTSSVKTQRFQTLISLMLSSQTKDTVTSVAVLKLQTELEGGLCLESILNIDEGRLDQLIRAVGFHTKKASYIKRTAEILRDEYDGDIPDTIEGLIRLPGVGPKMGYLVLQVAWNKNHGIGVDVHVHRITNRLGWVKTKTPEETRISLQSWLPKDKWRNINPILVGFGQIVCLPRFPLCHTCPVFDYCPSAEIRKKTETKSVYFKKEEMLDW